MTPKEIRGALAVLAVLLPSLAAVFWSAQQSAAVPRLGALRAGLLQTEQHAVVAFDGALHLLDAQGRRLARQPLADLGLAEEPSDIDWTVDAQGRSDLWVFEDSRPRLLRCAVEALPMPRVRPCVQVLEGRGLKVNRASRAVHIAVDLARERVYIADAKGHAVRALTLQGDHLGDSRPGELFFPNRLRLAGNELAVADNDHRRLVWLDVSAQRPTFQPRLALAVGAHPQGDGGRKAADFAFIPGADGRPATLWLLALRQGQARGTVLVYGPGPSPRGRADLGPYADPLVVDRMGESLLVSDFDGFALYRIGQDGAFRGHFAWGAMAQELARARQADRVAQLWKYGAWAGVAASLLLGLALAWRFSERPGARELAQVREAIARLQGAAPPAPLQLRPAAWFGRRVGVLFGLVVLIGAAMVAVFAISFPQELPASWERAGRFAGPGALFVGAMGAAAWLVRRTARRELWLAQDRVEIRLGATTLAASALHEVLASPRALLVGAATIPYRAPTATRQPGRWIFEEGPFTRGLLARLRPEQVVSDGQLARRQLGRAPRWQQALLAATILAAVAFALWLPRP